MDFPDSIKLEAKRRANFQCVVCRRIGMFLHVHHIIPQEESGSGDLWNAAPLCVECHDLHGNDRNKRNWIRDVRNWWWEECAKHGGGVTALNARLDELQTALLSGQAGLLAEVKTMMSDQFRIAEAAINSASTVQELIKASSTGLVGTAIGTSRIYGTLTVKPSSESA